jgi:type I restriction enzyme S subunit
MIEKVSIEEFAIIVRGSSPRPSGDPRYYGGTIPRLMVSDVTRDGMYVTPKIDFLTEEGATKSRAMLKGDLVIAVSGDPGEPCILNVDACIHDGFVGLRSLNKKKVFAPFLYHFLKFNKKNNRDQAVGAIYKNLNTDQIKNLQIPLPPLEQQKKIAAILDATDAYRQLTKALIAKYDELTQSLFLDMFGDPVKNEKGWELKILESLVSKLGDGLHGTPEYSDDGEYYFINGNNLQQGKIVIDSNTKKVSESEYLKHKKDLGFNTVLVSINGSIGKVAFYNNEPVILGKSACYFNLISGIINKIFLYHIIDSPYFLKYARGEATGSTIKNVSLKSMRNFPIPNPPLALQNQFAESVQAIEEQKAQAQASLEKAEELFNSLLQRAFNGELV